MNLSATAANIDAAQVKLIRALAANERRRVVPEELRVVAEEVDRGRRKFLLSLAAAPLALLLPSLPDAEAEEASVLLQQWTVCQQWVVLRRDYQWQPIATGEASP